MDRPQLTFRLSYRSWQSEVNSHRFHQRSYNKLLLAGRRLRPCYPLSCIARMLVRQPKWIPIARKSEKSGIAFNVLFSNCVFPEVEGRVCLVPDIPSTPTKTCRTANKLRYQTAYCSLLSEVIHAVSGLPTLSLCIPTASKEIEEP